MRRRHPRADEVSTGPRARVELIGAARPPAGLTSHVPVVAVGVSCVLEALMTASAANGSHPGLMVGPTSEFSLFFRVKPGRGPVLAGGAADLQDTPGYRPGDYGMAIQTIHEARFVLFDDDTRLAFITSFDGPWDAYMEDFFTSGPTLALFDADLPAHRGLRRAARPGGRQGLRSRRGADGSGVCAQLRRHGQGDPEGAAGERGVPAGARPPAGRGDPPASGAAAAAGEAAD